MSKKASDITSPEISSVNVLGFSPLPSLFENRILINTQSNTGIIEANGISEEFKFFGKLSPIKDLTLSFSQKNPLWYAPASYFESRKLETPAEGSKHRFLKKALGEEAVFLSNGEVIYSSDMTSTEEISGIQVPQDTLKKFVELSKIKSTIIVN